jgi:hypothetical protein
MSNHRSILIIVVLLLVAGVLASCGGGAAKPTVEILSPPSGTQVALGEQLEVEYRASDATAVIRVDLEIDARVVDSQSAPVAEGQPSLSGMLRWTPTEEGTYALLVYAYNRDRVASDPVGVNIVVGEGAAPETTVTISLILPGATGTPSGMSTEPPEAPTVTPTGRSAAPTATPTGRDSTATPTTRPPTATPTRRPPTATPTQPPPPPPTATPTRRPPTATPTEGPVPARIELINNSGEDVFWVHFASPHHSFADDQLGSDIVPAGQHYNWNILSGTYRLQAVASDGYLLDDRSGVNIHGHYQWVIPQTRQPQMSRLVVVNECAEPIVYLYLDAYPGVNLVQEGAMFQRESRVFEVPPGIWPFVARDQWNQMLDGGQAQFDPGSDVYF